MEKSEIPIDIAGLRAAYARGLAPEAVIEHVFDMIATVDDPGIFITLRDKQALLGAAHGLRVQDREVLPLWGIPFAVKDNIEVAGLPTTGAAPALHACRSKMPCRPAAARCRRARHRQDQSGPVRDRSRRRAHAVSGSTQCFQRRVCARGSSSGSAVAVARGIVPFALGTDTAGSGRVPAGLNNIVGLNLRSEPYRPSAYFLPAARSTASPFSRRLSTTHGPSTIDCGSGRGRCFLAAHRCWWN